MIWKEVTLTCFVKSLSEAQRVTKRISMILSINFPKEGMILVNINNRGSVRLFVHTYRMRVLIFAGNPRKFRSLMHHALLIFMRNSHQLGLSTGPLSSIRNRKTVEKKITQNRKKIRSNRKPYAKPSQPISFYIPVIKTLIDPIQR